MWWSSLVSLNFRDWEIAALRKARRLSVRAAMLLVPVNLCEGSIASEPLATWREKCCAYRCFPAKVQRGLFFGDLFIMHVPPLAVAFF